MNRFLKLVVWVCLITCIFSCVGCKEKIESKPILKVRISHQSTYLPLLNKKFYLVYDNGKTEEIPEFESSETNPYYFTSTGNAQSTKLLSGIDMDTIEGEHLNNIAQNIIILTSNNDSFSSPYSLYVINNKFYFLIAVYEKSEETSAIFEYIESDNSIHKIVAFKGSIERVEPYQ